MNIDTEPVIVGKYTVQIIKDDQFISPHLRQGLEWDSWMREDIKLAYRDGTDIIDVGGHIGWNALMFSEYGPVHTFEPIFQEIIDINTRQNITTFPITCYPYGLSSMEKNGSVFVPRSQNNVTNYGGTTLHYSPDMHEKSIPLPVVLKKLDDVYFGTPSVIKMDVEGHELHVIKGALHTIQKHKPTLLVEIWDFDVSEIPLFLKEMGYTVYERPRGNYIFKYQD